MEKIEKSDTVPEREMRQKNTREKVEEWLKQAPKEILIADVYIEPVTENKLVIGQLTPIFVEKGYQGVIKFACIEWT